MIYKFNPELVSPLTILITGFATALAIGISGLWGAFLSEDAERKKKLIDLKKAMVILDDETDDKKKRKEKKV